jgi:tRNA pseudouridine55 synthase
MPSPSGLLVVDKPLGLTSHDVVQRVRRATGVRRVGHAGTLDPLAGGVLVVCVGWATRLVEYVQAGRKTYVTPVRLGQTTTTYDAEGEVVAEAPVDVTTAEIEAALAAFRGPIRQQAPAYSAIKRDGQPLYKAARRGEAIELPVREVTIYALDLLAYAPPDVHLRVVCSPGTYIRSLGHDLGGALGCGGHLVALRRTASGSFDEADAVPLDGLTAETWRDHLTPPEAALAGWPSHTATTDEVAELAQGRAIPAAEAYADGTLVAALGPDGRLLGVVRVAGGQLQPHKMAPTN